MLCSLARRKPSTKDINKLHELHAQHSQSKIRQEIEEERAGQGHIEISLPVDTLARRCSPQLSQSLESLQAAESGPSTATSRRKPAPRSTHHTPHSLESSLQTAYATIAQLRELLDQAHTQRDMVTENWRQYANAYEEEKENYRNLEEQHRACDSKYNALGDAYRVLQRQYDEAKHHMEHFQNLALDGERARTLLEQKLEHSRAQNLQDANASRERYSRLETLAQKQTDQAKNLQAQLTSAEKSFEETTRELDLLKDSQRKTKNQTAELNSLRVELEKQSNKIASLERRNLDLASRSSRYRSERDEKDRELQREIRRGNDLARESERRAQSRQSYGRPSRDDFARPDSGYESERRAPQRSRPSSRAYASRPREEPPPMRDARNAPRYGYERDRRSHRSKTERRAHKTADFVRGLFEVFL